MQNHWLGEHDERLAALEKRVEFLIDRLDLFFRVRVGAKIEAVEDRVNEQSEIIDEVVIAVAKLASIKVANCEFETFTLIEAAKEQWNILGKSAGEPFEVQPEDLDQDFIDGLQDST